MEKYDVAIAGAGVAGCHAARNLARMGRSVVLIDRREASGLGHDWWDNVNMGIYDEVGLPAPEPPELLQGNINFKVFPPGQKTFSFVADTAGKMNVDRKMLAARQLRYAVEAGARFMEKTAALAPIVENDRVVGMVARAGDGSKIDIRASITIDATGISGALRQHSSAKYGFSKYISRSEMFVTHREIHKDDARERESRVVFGINNGVQWIHREQPGMADFFAGFINFPGRPRPRDIVAGLLASTPDVKPNLLRGGYGAPIPVRRGFDSFVADGFILCGDSACQCNPIDGSGVGSSLRAATIAARVIHSSLENGRTDVEALWPYNAEYKRLQDASFAQLHALQMFLVSQPKKLLDILLGRGIIKPRDFWGTGKAKQESALGRIIKLMKMIDNPSFIFKLVDGMSTAKKANELYMQFPEKHDPAEFEKWRRGVNQLFATIPPALDAPAEMK